MAKSKKAGTDLVSMSEIEKQLAVYAADAAKTEENVSSGKFVSVRAGMLSIGGTRIKDNKLQAIVIGSVMENSLYLQQFDPDTPASPDCYAFGTSQDDMVPHPNASDKQSKTCKDCRMNEWGSVSLLKHVAKGRDKGKACKNVRRLMLLEAGALDGGVEAIAEAQAAFLKVPVTSVAAWAGYVKRLEGTLKRPPFAVVTEIAPYPDEKSQFKLEFSMVSPISNGPQIQALQRRADEAKTAIVFPYPARSAATEPEAKPARQRRTKF
jgi:hypothetical protein